MKLIKTAVVGAAIFSLSGCTASFLNTAKNDDFACAENKDCPTPLEVYAQTNASPKEVRVGRTPNSWISGQREKPGSGKEMNLVGQDINLHDLTKNVAGVTTTVDGVPIKPMRDTAKVLRIWVAPWVDKEDNLNMPGHMFVDVSPRKWNFGEQEIRNFGLPAQLSPGQ